MGRETATVACPLCGRRIEGEVMRDEAGGVRLRLHWTARQDGPADAPMRGRPCAQRARVYPEREVGDV
ncbi:MAG: hypothetical protein JWM10_2746 [Myxococcaceae bacterium]|nr:hypothetical protein [Myxococcaceae bacterium]